MKETINSLSWNHSYKSGSNPPNDFLQVHNNDYFFEPSVLTNPNHQQNPMMFSPNSNTHTPYKLDFETDHNMKNESSNSSIYSEHEYYNQKGETSVSSDGSTAYASPSTSASSPSRFSYTTKSPRTGVAKKDTVITKRSRMGCLTCRSRKKRCCETKPKCHECARLGLNCTWPVPGSEHRNKPRLTKEAEGLHYDAFYGHIKILRGIVENKINVS